MATPTELYLIRHAIAAELGSEWPDDTKRPLTERGMSRFKDAVKGLRRLDVAVDEIFTSPLVRARQTADIRAAGLDGKPPIKVLDAQNKHKLLAASKDRVIGDPDLLQLSEQFRPNARVFDLILLNRVFFDPKLKRVSRHRPPTRF